MNTIMEARSPGGVYTHSGLLSETPYNLRQLQDQKDLTIQNIAPYIEDRRLAVAVGLKAFDLTKSERDTRQGWQLQLVHALGSRGMAHLFSPDRNDIARSALYQFINLAEVKARTLESHLFFESATGIPGELGHVDQYGNWGTTKTLDDTIDHLPHAPAPDENEPLMFEKVFEYGEGKRSYDLKMNGNALLLIRKRPIADIADADGNKYEIIKRSSWMVFHQNLSTEQREVLENELAARFRFEDDKETLRQVGRTIIDPIIEDKERRKKDPYLFPISALYFVMLRNQSRAQSPITPE